MICDADYDQDKIPSEAGEGMSSFLRIPIELVIWACDVLFNIHSYSYCSAIQVSLAVLFLT